MKSAKAKLIIIKLVIERSSFVHIIDPIIRMLPKKPPKTPKPQNPKTPIEDLKLFICEKVLESIKVLRWATYSCFLNVSLCS